MKNKSITDCSECAEERIQRHKDVAMENIHELFLKKKDVIQQLKLLKLDEVLMENEVHTYLSIAQVLSDAQEIATGASEAAINEANKLRKEVKSLLTVIQDMQKDITALKAEAMAAGVEYDTEILEEEDDV